MLSTVLPAALSLVHWFDTITRRFEFLEVPAMRNLVLLCVVLMAAFTWISGACAQESEKPLKIVAKQDVLYGRVLGAGLLADVAYPEAKGPYPVILSVHGGRWVG